MKTHIKVDTIGNTPLFWLRVNRQKQTKTDNAALLKICLIVVGARSFYNFKMSIKGAGQY